MGKGKIAIKGTLISKKQLLGSFAASFALWTASIGFWHFSSPTISLGAAIAIAVPAVLLALFTLILRFSLNWKQWAFLWIYGVPCLLSSAALVPFLPTFVFAAIIPLWLLLGLWGIYRFTPFDLDTRLHKARYANADEKAKLLLNRP